MMGVSVWSLFNLESLPFSSRKTSVDLLTQSLSIPACHLQLLGKYFISRMLLRQAGFAHSVERATGSREARVGW